MREAAQPTAAMVTPVMQFYDGLAADYHLVYGDRWDEAVADQGRAIAALIRATRPKAIDVLDCSCGIGTQAIGLAQQGYRVTGTDLSQRSIERARVESTRLGADVTFAVADFRDLAPVAGDFDVVISCDNALPHLLDDADVLRALQAMRAKLRPGGLLAISTRDFDQAHIERPSAPGTQLIAGDPRRIVIRMHDWDAPDSPLYTARLLVLTESSTGWTVAQHSTRFRAITSTALALSAEKAGFNNPTWITSTDAGINQPVMTAENPAAYLPSPRQPSGCVARHALSRSVSEDAPAAYDGD